MGFDEPRNHWPRVHLNWIFVALVVVVVLAFIECEVDLPEQGRSAFSRRGYHSVNVVSDGVAELKAQFRIVETTRQVNRYPVVQDCSRLADQSAPSLNLILRYVSPVRVGLA